MTCICAVLHPQNIFLLALIDFRNISDKGMLVLDFRIKNVPKNTYTKYMTANTHRILWKTIKYGKPDSVTLSDFPTLL